MKEALEKAFYTGLGFISMGKDAIEKAIDKLSKDLKLSEEEGKKFAQKASEETAKARENLNNYIEKVVTGILEKLHVATTKELKDLDNRIAALEKTKKSASRTTAAE